jgi:glycosyltransferase involved in cell wall biosynthesis
MFEFGFLNIFARFLAPKIIHKLRKWDFVASSRPDFFIANSINTKNRIKKYYKRESEVIYPCIDTSKFKISKTKKDFYLYV